MKHLILLRHAKAEPASAKLSDVERPLAKAAEKELKYAAEVLKKKNIEFQLMVCSPALRTLQTANRIAEKINYPLKKVQKEVGIYEAEVKDLLDVINHFPDSCNTIMLIGHNPGLSDLIEYLCGNMMGHLPTGGIAGLSFELDSWKLLSSGTGELKVLDYLLK